MASTNGKVAVLESVPQATVIEIPRISVQRMHITLIGTSPLISHAWSPKAKQMMLDKQTKKAAQKKDAKEPFTDYIDSLYWLTPRPAHPDETAVAAAQFGFPSVAFKASAVAACRFVNGIKMTEARGAFHIAGEFVPIEGHPSMREDMVRLQTGVADIRYRGEFKDWKAVLPVDYNTAVLSPEQILNLFSIAGFGVGVGEWRPSTNGSFGMFRVATQDD